MFLSVLYACVFYFCICTCSAQLSMFHIEKRSSNTLIIIIIIIIVDISINWATNRNWQTNILDTWKVTQLNLPHQKSVKHQ